MCVVIQSSSNEINSKGRKENSYEKEEQQALLITEWEVRGERNEKLPTKGDQENIMALKYYHRGISGNINKVLVW